MAKFDSPLRNLKVASPCSQDWNAMVGNERRRYCGECKLNVYNLSGMSASEAENLLLRAEGRLCVRYYQRADGSVLTEDCPVGWARVKHRTQLFLTAAASLIFSFLGALGLQVMVGKAREMSIRFPIPFVTPTPRPLMGAIPMPTPTPKQSPTPKATPKEKMGEIPVPKKVEPETAVVGQIETSRN